MMQWIRGLSNQSRIKNCSIRNSFLIHNCRLINKIRMYRIILVVVLLISPTVSFAQIQIGDIEVESLDELFNKESNSLWNEFGVFNKADSETWVADMPSMLVETNEDKIIILAFRKDLDQDSVRTFLINQLNDQFGAYEEKTIPFTVNQISFEWYIKENEIEYLFSISKDKKVGALNIFQM